jgi:hypothetical protein
VLQPTVELIGDIEVPDTRIDTHENVCVRGQARPGALQIGMADRDKHNNWVAGNRYILIPMSRGYCVSTVGLNEEMIRKYVRWQQKKDREEDVSQTQLPLE